MGCKKKILQVIADGLSYGLFMSTFLPRRSGFHHGGRFSRLHSVISRSNQHVYSTHYTSSCTPHVSIISREPYVIKLCHESYVMIGYDQIEQILNWCGYKILESYKITKRSNGSRINRNRNLVFYKIFRELLRSILKWMT